MSNIRLLPLIMIAASSMLVLRGMSIISDGRLNAFGTASVSAQQATAPLNTPEPEAQAPDQLVAGEGDAPNAGTQAVIEEKNTGDIAGVNMQSADGNTAPSPSTPAMKTFSAKEIQALRQSGMSQNEINLLLRLRERREELDGKERQLELRENMLRKVETSLQSKLDVFGADSESPLGKLDENGQLIEDNSNMEQLGAMYEAMKPKDAARIMSRLSTPLLQEIATIMNPRKMSAIMAKMTGDAAERLTLAMANNARSSNTSDLPQVGANGLTN